MTTPHIHLGCGGMLIVAADDDRLNAIDQHVNRCADCRNYAAELRRVVARRGGRTTTPARQAASRRNAAIARKARLK